MSQKTSGFSSRAEQTKVRLRQEIERGRFAGLDVLPGERDLAETLGVSRTTLRRAMTDLIQTGLLAQRRGYGTYVVQGSPHARPSSASAGHLRPVSQTIGPGDELMARGEASGFRDLGSGLFLPLADEAAGFALHGPTRVWRARRLWLDSDGRPLALERATMEADGMAPPPTDPAHWVSHIIARGVSIARIRRVIRTAALGHELRPDGAEKTSGILIEQQARAASGALLLFWSLERRLTGFEAIYDLPRPSR